MFSVVIPLYNKELSIRNTIKSVLNQSYQNFEIVIVDDGSSDNSIKVVKEFKDERIRIISQSNSGVSAARNKGVEKSLYDWIAFLDGDDIWQPNHLEEVLLMMKEFPNAECYTTSFIFSDARPNFQHSRKKNIFQLEQYFSEALYENLMWTSTVVINKESFQKIGGFNYNITNGEDLECWARIARHYNIIKSLTVTAIYRVEAENRTNLNKIVEDTHVFYLNLNHSLSEEEFNYYQSLIINRMIAYTKTGNIRNILKLKRKHRIISWHMYFLKLANISRKKLSSVKM